VRARQMDSATANAPSIGKLVAGVSAFAALLVSTSTGAGAPTARYPFGWLRDAAVPDGPSGAGGKCAPAGRIE